MISLGSAPMDAATWQGGGGWVEKTEAGGQEGRRAGAARKGPPGWLDAHANSRHVSRLLPRQQLSGPLFSEPPLQRHGSSIRGTSAPLRAPPPPPPRPPSRTGACGSAGCHTAQPWEVGRADALGLGWLWCGAVQASGGRRSWVHHTACRCGAAPRRRLRSPCPLPTPARLPHLLSHEWQHGIHDARVHGGGGLWRNRGVGRWATQAGRQRRQRQCASLWASRSAGRRLQPGCTCMSRYMGAPFSWMPFFSITVSSARGAGGCGGAGREAAGECWRRRLALAVAAAVPTTTPRGWCGLWAARSVRRGCSSEGRVPRVPSVQERKARNPRAPSATGAGWAVNPRRPPMPWHPSSAGRAPWAPQRRCTERASIAVWTGATVDELTCRRQCAGTLGRTGERGTHPELAA